MCGSPAYPTQDVDRHPAEEICDNNEGHLASGSHLTFLLLTTSNFTRLLDKVEDVCIHQEDEYEGREVQSMKDGNRIFPARHSFIS